MTSQIPDLRFEISNVISALALLPILLAGCDSTPSSGLPTTAITIGSTKFTLEIADADPARQKGLMDRPSLPPDRGMLFVFPDEQPRSFWMKNVNFPLDILFLDRDGRVVSIKQMKSYDLNSTPSDAPAMFAIELNAGAASRAGVKVGDRIALPVRAAQKEGERP